MLHQLHSAHSQLPFFSPPQQSESSNPSILQPREADLQHASLNPADTLCAEKSVQVFWVMLFVFFYYKQEGDLESGSEAMRWELMFPKGLTANICSSAWHCV